MYVCVYVSVCMRFHVCVCVSVCLYACDDDDDTDIETNERHTTRFFLHNPLTVLRTFSSTQAHKAILWRNSGSVLN